MRSTKTIKIKVVRDDDIEGMGAWVDGLITKRNGLILLNVEALIGELVDEKGTVQHINRARAIIETAMHEFGHAMEEALGVRHDETKIENATSRFFK